VTVYYINMFDVDVRGMMIKTPSLLLLFSYLYFLLTSATYGLWELYCCYNEPLDLDPFILWQDV